MRGDSWQQLLWEPGSGRQGVRMAVGTLAMFPAKCPSADRRISSMRCVHTMR